MLLPNFFIIGAPRCGTTSLFAYCRQHPEIYMSHIKEPNFFLFNEGNSAFGGPGSCEAVRTAIRNPRTYEKLFAKAGPALAVGEASVNYLISTQACDRIKARIPHAKLVVMLRQPVDRAYSSFIRSLRDGTEPCTRFEDAWADHERRVRENWWSCQHKAKSLYYAPLKKYLQTFSRDQIQIHLFEDLTQHPRAIIQQLFTFLGVNSAFAPDLAAHYNASQPVEHPLLRTLWNRTTGLRAVLAPALPLAWRGRLFVHLVAQRQLRSDQQPLPPGLRTRLTAELKDDILRLQDLIDRDLSHWLTGRK